jgi:hypothetical protein
MTQGCVARRLVIVLEVSPALYTAKLQFLLVYVQKHKVLNTTKFLVNIMTRNLRRIWATAVQGEVWQVEWDMQGDTGRSQRSKIHWRRIVQCDNKCMAQCKSDESLERSKRPLTTVSPVAIDCYTCWSSGTEEPAGTNIHLKWSWALEGRRAECCGVGSKTATYGGGMGICEKQNNVNWATRYCTNVWDIYYVIITPVFKIKLILYSPQCCNCGTD